MLRGLARAAAYEAADRLQPTVQLAQIARSGEEDCSAVHALMHSSARDAMSWDAVKRGLARASEYEAADSMHPTVLCTADARPEDSTAVNTRMQERSVPSVLAMLQGLMRAAEYEAAERLACRHGSLDVDQRGLVRTAKFERQARLRTFLEALESSSQGVKLADESHAGEHDCSAANALMHARVQESEVSAVLQRGLARAAAYEAADRLQPTVQLAQIARSGEEDCSAVHSQLHARSLPSELAMLRGLARAAAYEAADSMQPSVSLALTAQHGEEDCSAVHALMHASARDAISLDAVLRGLARAAAYEAADSMQPSVSLALTAQHGEEDCSAVHALMHARGSSSVAAVMRGLARAGVYETADLLDGLDPTGCSPSAPNSAINPLLALSTTLWLDAVALSLRPGGLPSVEVVISCVDRIRLAVLRERERQLLRMQDEDYELRRMLAAHHNAASHSQLSPYEAKSSWLIAVNHAEYAAHLAASSTPGLTNLAASSTPGLTNLAASNTPGLTNLAASITPGLTNEPAAFHCDRQTPTWDSTAGKALADHRTRPGSPRAVHAAALHPPSLLSRQQAPAATSHPAQLPPSPSDRARASEFLLRPPAQKSRKHPRKNGKLHQPHSSAPRSTPGSSAQMHRGQRSASRLRADKPSGTGV